MPDKKNLLATASGAGQQWMIHGFSLSVQESLPKGLNKLTLLDRTGTCTLASCRTLSERKVKLSALHQLWHLKTQLDFNILLLG